MPSTEPMSRVFLRNLAIEADIGCYAEEKGVMQPLIVTIDLMLGVSRFSDEDLGGTVDYTQLAGVVKVLGSSHIDLIETFAERLCEHCLALPNVRQARIKVEKPKAVPHGMAGVEIVRMAQRGS